MRISSLFHDYYDIGQSLGLDPSVVWNRKTEEVPMTSWPFPRLFFEDGWDRGRLGLSCKDEIVGFCGKIYGVLHVQLWRHFGNEQVVAHSVADFDRFIADRFRHEQVSQYHEPAGKYRRNHWPRGARREVIAKFFREVDEASERFGDIFIKNHCPVWLAKDTRNARFVRLYGSDHPLVTTDSEKATLTLCPRLKDLEFVRVMDPYQAWQEIQMYYAGVLAHPEKPIPTMPDEVMAQIKGFDKWSFRKEPHAR